MSWGPGRLRVVLHHSMVGLVDCPGQVQWRGTQTHGFARACSCRCSFFFRKSRVFVVWCGATVIVDARRLAGVVSILSDHMHPVVPTGQGLASATFPRDKSAGLAAACVLQARAVKVFHGLRVL